MASPEIFGSGFQTDSLANASVFGSGIDQGKLEDGTELQSMDAIEVSSTPRQDPIKAISGSIDPRIKFLSHSSSLTLHACPRKYQLYRLRARTATQEIEQSLTLSFGQVVGEGIQLALQGVPYRKILFKMFLMWRCSLTERDEKRHKSFAEAALAVRKFVALRAGGFLNDYELIYIGEPGHEVPACELGFSVTVFDGFTYRGFVDAVLRDKRTGEIIVLEVKTTWDRQAQPAKFKNSGQALGYSVVLDALFPGLSSYSVLYLVYSTTTLEFMPLPFPKSFESRAEWIRSIVFDVEDIIRYEEAGIYPRRGESCFGFNRACEYLDTCGLSTSYLVKPLEESREQMEKDESRYHYRFNVVDLINRQITRNAS